MDLSHPHLPEDVRIRRESEDILVVSELGVKLNGHPVLDRVSFRIKGGTTVAIVGPNGAGKTTLFRVLLNLVPYTGTVQWLGPVKIGYVPQRFAVADIPITVREFLNLKSKTGLEECLASVRLEGRDILDKKLSILSGGEMQRVLIAWAIVDRPNVLLFDEPTSSVDIGSEDLVYETLNRLEEETGITVLLISHDIHVVMHYSDAVLALNRSVRFFGDSTSLSDPVLLREIFGSGSVLAEHRH
jgi:zinc transport system ATP-binding protein